MIFECRLGWLQGIIFHAALVSYNQFCWTFHYSKETTKPIDHHLPHEQVYVLGIKSTRTTLHGNVDGEERVAKIWLDSKGTNPLEPLWTRSQDLLESQVWQDGCRLLYSAMTCEQHSWSGRHWIDYCVYNITNTEQFVTDSICWTTILYLWYTLMQHHSCSSKHNIWINM